MTPRLTVSRRSLLQSVALGALASCTGRLGGVAAASAVKPDAPRIPFRIEQLGRVRNDPYHWMKYIPETGARTMATLPAMLHEHLLDEADYTFRMLSPVRSRQPEIYRSMSARLPANDQAPAKAYGAWEYFSYFPAGSAHIVHARSPAGKAAEAKVLLDEGERAAGQSYFRTTGHQFSPDHSMYAWAEDVIGNDRHRICVHYIETGKIVTLVAEDAYGYGGVVFSPSSRWLFWIWRDDKNRPTKVFRTSLASGETALVYEETNPAIFMQLKRTAADGYIAIELSGPDTSEVRIVSARDETAVPQLIYARRDQIRYQIDEWQSRIVVLTNSEGALDNKLVTAAPDRIDELVPLVDHQPGTQILKVIPFERALARLERHDGQHRIVLLTPDGHEKIVAFGEAACTLSVDDFQSYAATHCRVTYQSPKTPLQWLDVDLADGAVVIVQKSVVPGFSSGDYVVERLFAPAPDGELVPITLLSRNGRPRDGSAPCLLYGYGAYGVSSDPEFSIPATVLADRGWTYAIAHVRGGSEKGQKWFLDGRKFQKKNSFTDFIACAEHLCNIGVTRKGAITAYGLSAGGLLVGGAMNLSPELWSGVIAKVPFVDMLNTMSDADHPLVPLFRPDWGDPLADPVAYDYMATISPYENVGRASYPPLLCTAGLKDDRVGYWEAAKFVSQVRYNSTSHNPALLLLDADTGHQGSGNRRDELMEMALFWAFAEIAAEQGFPG